MPSVTSDRSKGNRPKQPRAVLSPQSVPTDDARSPSHNKDVSITDTGRKGFRLALQG